MFIRMLLRRILTFLNIEKQLIFIMCVEFFSYMLGIHFDIFFFKVDIQSTLFI